jgi:hypothetical protein
LLFIPFTVSGEKTYDIVIKNRKIIMKGNKNKMLNRVYRLLIKKIMKRKEMSLGKVKVF